MRDKKMFRNITAVALIAIAVSGCGINNVEEQSLNNESDTSGVEEQSVKFNSADEFEAYIDGNISMTDSSEEVTFNPENEFLDLSEELMESVPDIDTITEEEFAAMDTDQFRAFIATYSPEFRSVYGIESDKIMTDEDWLSLKHLVNYRLFGTLWFDLPNEEFEESVLTEEEQISAIEQAKLEVYDVTNEDIDNIITLINESSYEDLILLIKEIFSEQGYNTDGLDSMNADEILVFREQLIEALNKLKTDETPGNIKQTESYSENLAEKEAE